MRIVVLGHRGMLGHVVAIYLAQQGYEVLTTNARYTGEANNPLIEFAANSSAEWIINAIGKLRSPDPAELSLINGQLPLDLKEALRSNQRLIHASSDGVFCGSRGQYRSDEIPDAMDAYGVSKIRGEAAAEPGRCYAIRTSIIGPATNNSGLMSWFLHQTGSVEGYTNHIWNGITTLEWAKLALQLITGTIAAGAILQTGSPEAISKFELLKLIAEVWNHQVVIKPTAAATHLDRTLIPDFPRPPIREQLADLYDWYHSKLGAA